MHLADLVDCHEAILKATFELLIVLVCLVKTFLHW